MGKAALFLVLSGMLAWTMTSMGDTETYLNREDEQANYEEQVLAREIATSWLNLESSELRNDFDGYRRAAYDEPYAGGNYDVEFASIATDTVRLTVNGFLGDAGFQYDAVYWKIPETQKIPPFFASGLNIELNIEMNAATKVLAGRQSNASVHTNQNLKNHSPDSYIEGFGTYRQNIENDGGSDEHTFQPKTNPDGSPVTERVDRIDIPALDINLLKSAATKTTSGNLELSGKVQLGSRDNPEIWYVESGKIFTSNDVQFSGYGVFISDHNVEFYNNTSFAPSGGSVMFLTSQNFQVDRYVSRLAGNMMANQNFKSDAKDLMLDGSITTIGNNLSINNPLTINYLPPLHTLTDPFWNGTETVIRPDAGEIVPLSITSRAIEGRPSREDKDQETIY